MKSISLNLDQDLYDEAQQIVNKLRISRNKYINDAVAHYNEVQKKQWIEEKLRKESLLLRKDSMDVLAEFESLEDAD